MSKQTDDAIHDVIATTVFVIVMLMVVKGAANRNRAPEREPAHDAAELVSESSEEQ